MRLCLIFFLLLMLGLVQIASAAPAAIVNGEEISYDEYVATLETLPLNAQDTRQQTAGAKVLEQIVASRLLVQLADKEGVPVTDEQVEKRAQDLKTEGNLQGMLQSRFMTAAEFKRELKGQLAYINLAMKYAAVTDAEISDYYFKNKSKFNLPVRVKVGAVVTSDKGKIDKAAERLKKGEDLAAVVKDLSDDPITRQNAGILGWVWPKQQGVPGAVTNTAMGLAKGAVSSPIQVQGQWVILKAMDRQSPTPKPLEEVKDMIRQLISVEVATRKPALKQKMAEFRQASSIEVFVKRFSKDLPTAIKTQAEAPK